MLWSRFSLSILAQYVVFCRISLQLILVAVELCGIVQLGKVKIPYGFQGILTTPVPYDSACIGIAQYLYDLSVFFLVSGANRTA
jgi:hypothetical protein